MGSEPEFDIIFFTLDYSVVYRDVTDAGYYCFRLHRMPVLASLCIYEIVGGCLSLPRAVISLNVTITGNGISKDQFRQSPRCLRTGTGRQESPITDRLGSGKREGKDPAENRSSCDLELLLRL